MSRLRNPFGGGVLPAAMTLVIASLAPTPARCEDDAETVFQDARAYTVRIRTQITTPFVEDTRGSFEGAGFLVDAERGWIVTNAHVVGHSPSQVKVAFADEVYHPARKIYVDPFADIAVIHIDLEDRKRAVAPIGCGDDLKVGESIGAFGHPLGLPFTGTRGIISGMTDKFGPDLVQIDATVDHGNSGGPVIALKTRRVVGIATAGAGEDEADRLNFATPIEDACRILDLLRAGKSPSPPLFPVSLLKDEDGRTTLEVGASDDSKGWPLEQGDRIVSVESGDSLTTVGTLMSALRGREGRVTLHVLRAGQRRDVTVFPRLMPPIVARRGVSIDGALIAPIDYEDATTLSESAPLIVHSVDPGSAAEMAGLGQEDIVRSVDGKRFDDLDQLIAYLRQRPSESPLEIIVRRWSDEEYRIFEYHVRELPGEDVRLVGAEAGKESPRSTPR